MSCAIIKTPGSFRTDEAALKLLYLAKERRMAWSDGPE